MRINDFKNFGFGYNLAKTFDTLPLHLRPSMLFKAYQRGLMGLPRPKFGSAAAVFGAWAYGKKKSMAQGTSL